MLRSWWQHEDIRLLRISRGAAKSYIVNIIVRWRLHKDHLLGCVPSVYFPVVINGLRHWAVVGEFAVVKGVSILGTA